MATETRTPKAAPSSDMNGQGTANYEVSNRKMEWNLGTLDSILLAILIFAMCSQINVRAIGENTLKQGFATKQLFVALSDVVLLGTFAWFVIRTTMLRAWKRIWWPPAPCWVLIAAIVISALHSQSILNSISSALAAAESPGPKGLVKALITKESKEAIAHLIQYSAYFICAPLLFVNLICDRRGLTFINRRRLALHAFPIAVLICGLFGLLQVFTMPDNPPFGLFGSSNVYGGFMAIALPLLIAHMLREWNGVPQVFFSVGLALVLAIITISSIWSLLALLIGLLAGGLLLRQTGRTAILLGVAVVLSGIVWAGAYQLSNDAAQSRALWTEANKDKDNPKHPTRLVRADFLSAGSPVEKVKKQFIEWYAAMGWTMARAGGDLPEGERLKAFATGVGPGNYQLNIGPLYNSLPNEEKMPPDSNNLYLVEAVAVGGLGLSALLWMIGYFAKRAWELRHRFANDWLGAGVLASLVAFAFVNLFHALIQRGTGIVLAFLLSLAIIALQSEASQGPTNADAQES